MKYKHNFPKDEDIMCKEEITEEKRIILLKAIRNSNVKATQEWTLDLPYWLFHNGDIRGYSCFQADVIHVSFAEFLAYIRGEAIRLTEMYRENVYNPEPSLSEEINKSLDGLKLTKGIFDGVCRDKPTLSEQIKIKEKELAELKEKLAKENMPKDSEPCLVWDDESVVKVLRYSDGEGVFYACEEKTGATVEYENFVRITIHPDDEHKLKD